MSEPILPEHFSLADVAENLGVHPTTVWRWALTGVRGQVLPTFHKGGRRFVRRNDLDDFLSCQGQTRQESANFKLRQQNAAAILDGAGVKAR